MHIEWIVFRAIKGEADKLKSDGVWLTKKGLYVLVRRKSRIAISKRVVREAAVVLEWWAVLSRRWKWVSDGQNPHAIRVGYHWVLPRWLKFLS